MMRQPSLALVSPTTERIESMLWHSIISSFLFRVRLSGIYFAMSNCVCPLILLPRTPTSYGVKACKIAPNFSEWVMTRQGVGWRAKIYSHDNMQDE